MAHILFLCTGNTCRSVMAEGMARSMYPNHTFSSAGVMVGSSQPPTAATISVMEEIGSDVSMLRSSFVGDCDLRDVDHIYAMEAFHQILFDQLPIVYGGSVELLNPAGEDVSDPVGKSLEVYRSTRELIHSLLWERFGEETGL